jgi:hypothetical protein
MKIILLKKAHEFDTDYGVVKAIVYSEINLEAVKAFIILKQEERQKLFDDIKILEQRLEDEDNMPDQEYYDILSKINTYYFSSSVDYNYQIIDLEENFI